MALSRTQLPKARITVTMSPDLIRQVDTLVSSSEIGSRSLVLEEALRAWLRDQTRAEIDRQTEAYYQALPKAEREEDRQWSRLTGRAAKHLQEE